MGEGTKYRWQRRKKRQASALKARDFKTFWTYELILLAVVLTIGLLGARVILLFAILTSPCVEATAAFGTGRDGISVFDRLFAVSVLTGVFWVILGAKYFRVLWKTKSALFHMAMLGCIVLLMANFRMMHLAEHQPPDGIVSTKSVVLDPFSEGRQYFPIEREGDEYGQWYLGKPERSIGIHYSTWGEQCVWLKQNLITASADRVLEGYGVASPQERLEMLGSRKWRLDWEPMTIREQATALFLWPFGKTTPLETLKERQTYRPLTSEERTRFMAKQECLKTNMFSPTRFEDCKYYWGVNYSQMDLDYYMDRGQTIPE